MIAAVTPQFQGAVILHDVIMLMCALHNWACKVQSAEDWARRRMCIDAMGSVNRIHAVTTTMVEVNSGGLDQTNAQVPSGGEPLTPGWPAP